MSNLQSLADQLGWCITTSDYLNNDINDELRFVAKRYEDTVKDLRNAGYLSNSLEQIERMQEEFQRASEDLIRYIENEHLEYIKRQSGQIQSAMGQFL